MKDKILVFLKGKLKQGISKSYLDRLAEHYSKTITEESEIETTFTEGVITLLQLNADELQREGDRRVTDATDTALRNFKEKFKLNDEGKPISVEPPKPPNPDEPAWFTQFKIDQKAEADELRAKLEGIDKAKVQEGLTEKVKSHEKLKGIPASYLKGRNLTVESEDKIEELVSGIADDYTAFKQELTEQGINIDIPESSLNDGVEGQDEGKKLAEKRNASSSGDEGIVI